MRQQLTLVAVSLFALGCGPGGGSDGERTPGEVWDPDALGPQCQVVATIDGVKRSNQTIVPYPNSELIHRSWFDHERGRMYFRTELPRGTYIGDFYGSCTYRAPYGDYNAALRHFEEAPFGGTIEVEKEGNFKWPQLTWRGRETVEDVSAGWVLELAEDNVVPEDEDLVGSSSLAWPIISTRYGVLISRCYDGSYPPQMENTSEDNNVVCITIKDGGVRHLFDWVNEQRKAPIPDDDPRGEFATYPAFTESG